MPEPKNADAHVNAAIQDVAIGYENSLYIAERVFPSVNVAHKSDVYFKFTKGDRFRDEAANDRQPGTRAPRGGWNVTTEPYACKRISFGQGVPDMIVDNADDVVRPFENAASHVMEQINIRRERRLVTDIFATGKWDTDVVGGVGADKWDDYANGDPAKDISDGVDTILQNTGMKPNILVMGHEVMSALKQHPDAIDRYKHTQTGILTEAQVAAWLDIPTVLVGDAVYNSAQERQTTSMSFIWGKNVLLAGVTNSPSIDTPSAGYTFNWQGVSTKTYREEAEEQDVVEANVDLDMKLTASDLGYFFSGIVD